MSKSRKHSFFNMLCLVLTLAGSTAYAGGDVSGGGDLIVCIKGWFSHSYYLADTFRLVRTGVVNWDPGLSEEANRDRGERQPPAVSPTRVQE